MFHQTATDLIRLEVTGMLKPFVIVFYVRGLIEGHLFTSVCRVHLQSFLVMTVSPPSRPPQVLTWHRSYTWPTSRSGLRSGTRQERRSTTASLPCTTEEPTQRWWCTTSANGYLEPHRLQSRHAKTASLSLSSCLSLCVCLSLFLSLTCLSHTNTLITCLIMYCVCVLRRHLSGLRCG